MKSMNVSRITGRAAAMTLVKAALLSGVLVTFAPGAVLGDPIEKKGTTPYVTHFIFRPLMNIDIPGLGTATPLEAVQRQARARIALRSGRPQWCARRVGCY